MSSMRRQIILSLSTLSFCALVRATAPYECVSGINYALSLFNFASNTNASELEEDYYTKTCQNTLLMTSTWAAAQLYCTPREIIAGQNYLNSSSCEPFGYMPILPYSDFQNNLTDKFINSLQIVDYDDITNDSLIIFNTSILLSKDLANTGFKTVATWDNAMVLHQSLGWANYGFWGLILLTGILSRLISHLRSTVSPNHDLESISQKHPTGPIYQITHWTRTNLIIPATFGTYRQRLFYYCTVTTRLETLIIVLYYIMSIFCASFGYVVFSPNLYYTTRLQSWRYFADRTGILAYSNLPLLWMFSGRNNVFIWATGWSFSRFNIFHRHIARVAVVEAIAHSVAYTVEVMLDGGKEELAESWAQNYWYMGGIATISMSLILVTSSIFLRLKRYEVFLILHVGFSILTIYALFRHTSIFSNLEWNPYLWPLVAIWSFDRLVRLLRQAYVNLHVSASNGLQRTSGEVSYDAAGDLLILNVATPGGKGVTGNGLHYFVYQYDRWRGWENHPFSLASWSTSAMASLTTSSSSSNEIVPATLNYEITSTITDKESKTTIRASSSETSISTTPTPTSPSSISPKTHPSTTTSSSPSLASTKLTFYIRPVSGFTARLKQQCLAHSSLSTLPLNVILEGPYGHSSHVAQYQTLVLVAGGTGIAGVLPLLRHEANSSNQKKNIKLLWSCKHAASISSIIAREKGGEFNLLQDEIALNLHATRDREKASEGKCEGLEIKKGRADVKAVIRSEVLDATVGGNGGKVVVIVCGPPSMADEGRDAVHSLLKEGVRGLEFVEESFGW